jgi:hypothetical protein
MRIGGGGAVLDVVVKKIPMQLSVFQLIREWEVPVCRHLNACKVKHLNRTEYIQNGAISIPSESKT